ncbi:MAG: hypothetical protein OM95_00395 [Bdellovibrio sp. ArHS]|uniref:hypothetical protein n=1 Tax=Bdellovibrio sp. ArHS TaxID=1569284 RepID=UPI000583058D|nr:hypothetical protein [Bdellovibrio sp. ArHS]KHD90022.1 MAG: hypothetical protein OM95_00395 [Bdellovibrio sp. ArHS]
MKDVKKDFESFINDTADVGGSSFVLQKIHAQLAAEKSPPWKVIAKMGLAHTFGSVVTLMSCSQFGVQLFFDGGGLMHYFMKISPTFCLFFCGALYLSISVFFARLILNHDEWIRVMRSRSLSLAALSLITLGALSVVSHEVTWESGVLWFFGAALGGEMMTLVKSPLLWLARR